MELERPLTHDVRLQWQPTLHKLNATVQRSGFEGFTVKFAWSEFWKWLGESSLLCLFSAHHVALLTAAAKQHAAIAFRPPAARYIKHLRDKGYNGMSLYGTVNCWVKEVSRRCRHRRAGLCAAAPWHVPHTRCCLPSAAQIKFVDCDNGIFLARECPSVCCACLGRRRAVLPLQLHTVPRLPRCRKRFYNCA